MATTLTVITENTVPGKAAPLYAKHGFSLFLSRPEARSCSMRVRPASPRSTMPPPWGGP